VQILYLDASSTNRVCVFELDSTEDMVQWQVLVNEAVNLRVSKKA
jgi:hypothetical protein